MSEPKQNREADNLRREAEDELLRMTLELKDKTDLWLKSRQRTEELRHRAEFLKKQVDAAKERAGQLRAKAREIRRAKTKSSR